MKSLPLGLLAVLFAGSIGLLAPPQAGAQGREEPEYRKFTGANGTVIEAVLLDKSDTEVILLLKGNKRAKIPYDKLSDEDQKYIRSWNKEKAVFLQQCRSLTVRQLLELRGYESFKYQLDGNSIIVKGTLNGKESNFLIDTGAHSSVLHLESAKEAECKIGPMDQKIYGIGGVAPAAWSEVDVIKLGESVIKEQRLLTADLYKDRDPGEFRSMDAIFGAEFLTQLRAVISYKEGRIFLRPDLADVEGDPDPEEPPDFRLFKAADGKTFRGNITGKTASAVSLKLENGKEMQFAVRNLSPEDQEYVGTWTQEAATFMKHCRGLTVQDLLELRRYQSFEYERKGNHIFVDGKLNERETTFMIDTGADTSLLHIETAKEAACEIGPMDQIIHGVAGNAPAAVTRVKSLMMGEAHLENRKILSADIFKNHPGGGEKEYGAIFGADFMRELDGVITYREKQIFLRQE